MVTWPPLRRVFLPVVIVGSMVCAADTSFGQNKQPAQLLHDYYNKLGRPRNFPEVTSRQFTNAIGRDSFLQERDGQLNAVVSNVPWNAGNTERPLQWNVIARRFEISVFLLESPPPVIRFVRNFLVAYSNLSRRLRSDGAPLATGMAALIASEESYGTNMALLPEFIQEQAAIVHILLLYRRDILGLSREENQTILNRELRAAVSEMCAVDGEVPLVLRQHQSLDWLTSQRDAACTLSQFLPPHRQSLEALLERVKHPTNGISNLPLRALITLAICRQLHGIPSMATEPEVSANAWDQELKELLPILKTEMRLRGDLTFIARRYPVGREDDVKRRSLLSIDPGILRPLMEMAGHAAEPELVKAAVQGDPNTILAAMSKHLTVQELLQLVGDMPEAKESQHKSAILELAWQPLVRVIPRGRDRLGIEIVRVTLAAYRGPAGSVVSGIEGNMRVRRKGEGDLPDQLVPVREIQEGDHIEGFAGLPSVSGQEAESPRGELKPQWYTVVNVASHTALITYHAQWKRRDRANASGHFILGPDHYVLMAVHPRAQWRKVGTLDPGTTFWSKASTLECVLTLPSVGAKQVLFQFSLMSEEQRGEGSNLIVYGASDDDENALVVEAHAVDAGPVHPETMLLSETDASMQVGNLIRPEAAPGVIIRGWTTPEGESWGTRSLNQHATPLNHVKQAKTRTAVRLTFNEGRDHIILGHTNWVLQWVGNQIREIPVRRLEKGALLVSGLLDDGIPDTIRLTAIEPFDVGDQQFIQVQSINVPWAKLGPIIVSIDYEPRDAIVPGIGIDTHLSLPIPMNSAIAVADDELPVDGITDNDSPQILTHDMGLPYFSRLRVRVNQRESTRSYEITARSDREVRQIRIGPGQPLLVDGRSKRGQGIHLASPSDILKGCRIAITTKGARKCDFWPIDDVRIDMHPPRPLATLTEYDSNWLRRADTRGLGQVAFANGLGVALLAKQVVDSQDMIEPVSQQQEGRKFGGLQKGTQRSDELHQPNVDENASVDLIHVPQELRQIMATERPANIMAEYRQAAPNMRVEWDGPVFAYWRKRLPDFAQTWPDDAEERRASTEMWLSDLLRQRALFLEKPDVQQLPAYCFQCIVVASFLHELSSCKTAQFLMQDMIEIVICAACEPRKEHRTKDESLAIALMMQTPGMVLHSQIADKERFRFLTMPLNPLVLKIVEQWPARTNNVVQAGQVSLRGMFVVLRNDVKFPIQTPRKFPMFGDIGEDHPITAWILFMGRRPENVVGN